MKLFFLDIDGTMCMPGRDPSPGLLEAIRALREQGDRVYLCTGRSIGFLPDAVRAIPLDGGIYSAGNLVTVGQRELYRAYLPEALQTRLTDAITAAGATYFLECEAGAYAGGADIAEKIRSLQSDSSMHSELGRLLRLSASRIPVSEYRGEPVFKVSFLVYSRDMAERMKQICPPGMHLVFFENLAKDSPVLCGEFTEEGSDKGTAMLRICRELGVTAADCVAFGDSMNDAPILLAAGEGIAMGNSDAGVRALADRVCGDCDEDGLALALAEYIHRDGAPAWEGNS